MGIQTKWIRLIHHVATGSRKTRLFLTPVVGLSYFLFSTLFVFIALITDRVWDTPALPPAPLHLYLGIPIITSGLILDIWCLFNFIRAKGTPVPFNPPPTLVRSGPYFYARNPMISGIFMVLSGTGLILQSVCLIFIFTPLFILINVLEIKLIEEPELAIRLGSEYIAYKEKTPMFFPRLKFK